MSAPDPETLPRASESDVARPSKDALRATVRLARAHTPDAERAARDAARLPRLLDACSGHATVACYASIAPEPDTTALITALSDAGVRVLLPVLQGRREPAWGWYSGPDALRSGWRGIPEPAGTALGAEALAACSFVWVSALQATPTGHRLGTGGGWYDRALLHADPAALRGALVNEDELVDSVPLDPWDLPVDLIVTPTRTLRAGGARRAG
ncbi:MAG: 5-formyltetrahydrofolate cyclo-ligase [Propionibacteriaceae bacterium]|nr:5-formyltetrahydrofolate cyclo-ligase [Propionibacteriaceae bacterium]